MLSPFNPPGPPRGDGLGLGARATIELVPEGFIRPVNDSVGIGFGVDWLHFEDADARDLYRILFEKLPQATVISVGRSSVLAGLHRRIFDLAGAAQASLKPSPAAVPAGAPAAP